MLISEYNYETDLKVAKRDGVIEGRLEGEAKGMYKWANKSLEQISEEMVIPLGQIQEWSKSW